MEIQNNYYNQGSEQYLPQILVKSSNKTKQAHIFIFSKFSLTSYEWLSTLSNMYLSIYINVYLMCTV